MLYEDDIARLETLQVFIKQHLQEDLSIEHLGRQFAIGTHKLQRQFKQQYKISLRAYVFMQRMRLARLLLIARTHSIAEAAFAVGYQDRSSFTRAFTRYHKQSPTDLLKGEAEQALPAVSSRL